MESIPVRSVVPIFKIAVDSTTRKRVLGEILAMLSSRHEKANLVVTPNPEILLAASQDLEFAEILNSAEVALPDGIGIVAAMRYLRLPAPRLFGLMHFVLVFQGVWVGLSILFNRKWLDEVSEVVPGRVVFEYLLKAAAKHGLRVFLLGGRAGVADAVALKFGIRNSKFEILADAGPWLDQSGKPLDREQAQVEREVIRKINAFRPHFLFVAFGPSKQEKWVARHLPKLELKVAMVVGGAFDYYAGKVPMPPKFMEKAGFEWLWRLLTQPWRAPRIFNAVVIFPWKVFLWKLKCTAAS